MFNKKSQSGRSMVEMLGVLAIIGVLSIGGIAGYTLSMRRHRANQILDLANKYALIIYGACQKAMVDGNITTLGECNHARGIPHFVDTNLGGVDITGGQSAGVYQQSGVDSVMVPLSFQDEAVCKAAQSIAGVKETSACKFHFNLKSYVLFPYFKFN